MPHSNHHVVVLGASPRPTRYSNQAVRMLLDQGYRVTPVHPIFEQIENLAVSRSLDAIEERVGTLTLYVSSGKLKSLSTQIVRLNPGRVIFNPGTESKIVQQVLDNAGIEWLEACTLVMLRLGLF